MKRIMITLAVLGLVAAGIVAFFMTASPEGASPADGNIEKNEGPLKVVTTTGMLADAVRHVGGTSVEVQSLMGPGIDPHLYKASAGDVQRMSNADMIIVNGLHLEGKMGEVFSEMQNRSIPTISVGDLIDRKRLLKVTDDGKNIDPHIWFDANLWAQAVELIRDALSKARPKGQSSFHEAAAIYTLELMDLNRYVSKKAKSLSENQRVLITAHDAFGYFARAYGFEVHGIQGVSTASEAGAKDVQRLAELISTRKIRAIFVESSVPPRLIEALQAAVRDRGFEVKIGGELFGDAMGPEGSGKDNYLSMVRHNIDTIVGALGDES